jgi:hypothetical protein
VDYATIDLTILGPASSSTNRGLTFGERIKQLFSGFGNFLSVTVVVAIGFVIFGIPILLILFFLYWILFGRIGLLKKLWRLAANKKQAK